MQTKYLALIAHDQKKDALLELVRRKTNIFRHFPLIATGSTGKLIGSQLGLPVECVAHGPHGGDLVIGSKVVEGQVIGVFFFRDPLTAQPHEPDVTALMRVCDVHNVPLATNLGSAAALLDWLEDEFLVDEVQ